MLARVKPIEKELWDFRVTAPDAGIRAFGGFAELDTFVILTWEYRDDIIDFNAEVERCMIEWRDMFGTVTPLKKVALNEYLSHFLAV